MNADAGMAGDDRGGPPVEAGIYSIGAVAAMTGIPTATIRTWEQRYAMIVPERTPGGHRLYSRSQVEELRFVAGRVESGMSPGDAHRELQARRSHGSVTAAAAVPGARLLLVFSANDRYGGEFADFFLQTEGYEPRVVTDAVEGEAAFTAFKPALVVVDLLVSSGAGLALCRRLRDKSEVPILAVSVLSDRDEALEAGASAFLMKPLDPLEFVAAVKDLLGKSAHLGGARRG